MGGGFTYNWGDRLGPLNEGLRHALDPKRLLGREERRAFLQERIGSIRRLERLEPNQLEGVLRGRPLVGVDCSVNSFGGQFPYWLALFRAQARPSAGDPLEERDVFTPLLPDGGPGGRLDAEAAEGVKKSRLAALEARAALKAIQRYCPVLLIMDGSFARFQFDNTTGNSFKSLKEAAKTVGTTVIGVIEGVASSVLPTLLGDDAPEGWHGRYDRELLWGILDYGEVLEVCHAGSKPGVRTWFMRASLDPGIVALDMFEEQMDTLSPLVIDYLFTLTPPTGRGIPIWIDMVDQAVRLTDHELETLVGAHIDRGVFEMLLAAKRAARVF